jgi:2-polyprenyl-3-methyl-5-hydroxy-6-metoxy-1,4-benzoquinol methylase/tetratricopeptide (TPR) repeat protein
MNRKQRRAALKSTPPDHPKPGTSPEQIFADAVRLQHAGKLDEATKLYKRLLVLQPDHAQSYNNLGCLLQAQGRLNEASACFAKLLTLAPQQFEQFQGVFDTFVAILPPIGGAMLRADNAWPSRLTVDQLFGSVGLSTICNDPMLLRILQSVPARNIRFERLLTSLRLSLLQAAIDANNPPASTELAFCCVLAKQCFINEYVFATTPDEVAQVDRLKAALDDAVGSGATIAPIWPAAIAMYQPLHTLPYAQALLNQAWPPALDDVITQQLREPQEERQLRNSIPRLTPIEDDTSQRVRQQYEENPYPRWVNVAGGIKPIALDQHLRNKFPSVPFTPIGKVESLEILVAGCGTGLQATGAAQGFQGARVLAVDLSLSSLSYAKRKTQAPLSERIEYVHGDILKLGALSRTFDLIDVTGVLHHMSDPFEGWRVLLTLLRPGGMMHLGFYSEAARGDVVAARRFIAERGYASTLADIRRCRQDLLQTPMGSVARFSDFFSTSECRDLLFHVQESRMTIPTLKAFIADQGLRFIGFDLKDSVWPKFRAMFVEAGWSPTDLDRWHDVETKYPDTFANMYQFWVQKP